MDIRYLGGKVINGMTKYYELNCTMISKQAHHGVVVWTCHYDDAIMGTIASQITSLTSVYSTVYSGADQSKHQSSASLAFVWGIHREPVNSPHKWPVTRKMFPFDDVIMRSTLETLCEGNPPINWSLVDSLVMRCCDFVFVVNLNRRWFEKPQRPCDVNVMQSLIVGLCAPYDEDQTAMKILFPRQCQTNISHTSLKPTHYILTSICYLNLIRTGHLSCAMPSDIYDKMMTHEMYSTCSV